MAGAPQLCPLGACRFYAQEMEGGINRGPKPSGALGNRRHEDRVVGALLCPVGAPALD